MRTHLKAHFRQNTPAGQAFGFRGLNQQQMPYFLKPLLVVLGFAGFFSAATMPTQSIASTSLTEARTSFVEAEKLLKRKRITQWLRIKSKLTDYPLFPYLHLKEIQATASQHSNDEIAQVVKQLDLPIPYAFQSWWLNRLISHKDWNLIVDHYASASRATTRCTYARALIHTGQVHEATPVIHKLWLTPHSQAKQCDAVFEYGLKHNLIDDSLIWQRIVLARNKGQAKLIKYLAGLLGSAEIKRWVTRLNQAHAHPRDTLKANLSKWSNSQFGTAVLEYCITRIARTDISEAAAIWLRLKKSDPTSTAKLPQIDRNIGRRLAIVKHQDAYQWLLKLDESQVDLTTLRMQARSALAIEHWPAVLSTIASMPEQEANKSRWQFWKAKALYAMGDEDKAEQIWSKISSELSFYGFMASDLLGQRYVFETANHNTVSDSRQFKVSDTPAIIRIREWLALDRPYSARRELRYISDIKDKDFWFNVAAIFHDWQWHDGAVRAIKRAGDKQWMRLDVSFPSPFLSEVRHESVRYGIPEYWIYGIMRQESNFVRDIRSGAGAIGLMQLMPSTARSTAKTEGLKKISTSKLTIPSINIRLGTAYFSKVLNNMNDNPIYALAGYNAGPTRSRHWQKSSRTSDSAIWIETIPFHETRNYVQNVLVNFIVYEKIHRTEYSRTADYLQLGNTRHLAKP